jgi:hypothetical protein
MDTGRGPQGGSGGGGSDLSGGSPSASTTSPGVTLASAFQALPDISPRGVGGSGLITSWQQSSGMLAVGGNSATIRLWDVAREMCVTTFHTDVETCLTCLVSQAAVYSQASSSSSSSSASQGSLSSQGLSSMEFSEAGATSSSSASAHPVPSWGDAVASSAQAARGGGNSSSSSSSNAFNSAPDGMPGGNGRGLGSNKPLESTFAWSFAGFADGSIGKYSPTHSPLQPVISLPLSMSLVGCTLLDVCLCVFLCVCLLMSLSSLSSLLLPDCLTKYLTI